MFLSPLLEATPAIQIHVLSAVWAIALLPVVLLRRRRDRLHKMTGYAWVTAMLVTAISSFWIHGIRLVGSFSPIHVLSVLTICNVIWAIIEVRRGRIAVHQKILRNTALWSLGVAGLFTLLPGRIMSEALFGDAQIKGFASTLVLVALLVARHGVTRRARGLRSRGWMRRGG